MLKQSNKFIKSYFIPFKRTTPKTIYPFSHKGILFYSRRRSRILHSFTTPNVMSDDVTYYKQMKEFIKESEGVPRNSQKWWELRNKHYKLLLNNSENDIAPKIRESMQKSYVRFTFIIIPEDPKCYELINLLNFYQIRYKAVRVSF